MLTHLDRYEGLFHALDEPAYIFTNSERSAFMCPRFWAYEYSHNIETGDRADALTYGVIVHRLLEIFLTKMKDTDALLSLEDMQTIHNDRTMSIIDEENEEADPEIKSSIFEKISRSLQGWRNNWIDIFKEWRIVGAELTVYAPIKDRAGVSYRSEIPCLEMRFKDGVYLRPARQGEFVVKDGSMDLIMSNEEIADLREAESIEKKMVDMPIYIVGRVDCLLQNRRDPTKLAIIDHKTTGQVWKYEKQLPYDIQLTTYAYLIENGMNLGDLDLQGCKVSCVMFDLLHSNVPDMPTPLKSGKLSTRASCPSWIYEQAVEHNGLDLKDYENVIEDLRLVDDKYFKVVKRDLFEEDTDRIMGELYYLSKKMIEHRKEITQVELSDNIGFDGVCARQPHQCILWGNCKFSTICLNNNIEYGMIREKPKLFWTSELKPIK